MWPADFIKGHTGRARQCEPHKPSPRRRPLLEPSSEEMHLGLQPGGEIKAVKPSYFYTKDQV